jgi:DNA repair protein RadA
MSTIDKEEEDKHIVTTTEEGNETIEDLDMQDVMGVGPTTAKKLRDNGVVSVMDLAVSNSDEISTVLNVSKEHAASFIIAAQQLLRGSNFLGKEFVSADVALETRKKLLRCTTGSKALDKLLLGGIETQSITEFYGEFGSGKSQVCHTLCVLSNQPIEEGGLDGASIYIDTEGTFRPERIEQIAMSRGIDPLKALQNIIVCTIYNSSSLEMIVKDLGKYLKQYKAKLIIIDSIIALHRAEFVGRGTLSDRQQRLNTMVSKIKRVAEIYNIAVVITNQVQASPDLMFGDPVKATGGNIIGHTSTYRIYLRKSGENRTAKMIDSPYHPYSDTKFTLTEKGVDDLPEEKVKRGSTSKAKDE